eukprot:snap_masked-scaffold_23-processed-gene-3.24-mRNA-1 protein AED:1.00 eAED:1.00 QI:0/0/0/0/1/1/2/0/104
MKDIWKLSSRSNVLEEFEKFANEDNLNYNINNVITILGGKRVSGFHFERDCFLYLSVDYTEHLRIDTFPDYVLDIVLLPLKFIFWFAFEVYILLISFISFFCNV